MQHPIQQSISRVQKSARVSLLIYAGCMAFALSVGYLLLLGLLDYLIRYQDRGLRVLASLSAALVLLCAVYRFVRPALKARLSALAIARKIEQGFPQLQDRLANAVAFLQSSEDDQLAGSPVLRRAVISSVTADLDTVDVAAIVDRRPMWRAVSAAALVLLLTVGTFVVAPHTAGLALSRLIAPWNSTAWPRQHHLAFKEEVRRVGRGETFEVELVDLTGQLPETARILYRFDVGGELVEEAAPMQQVGASLIARRQDVSRPFEYRAEGGDDTVMPWTLVEVIELPRAETISAKLTPPAYTLWPATTSDLHIVALRGTSIEITGKADRPIAAARYRAEGSAAVDGVIADDGVSFTISSTPSSPLLVQHDTAFYVELVDAEGFVGGSTDRYDIKAIADQAPHPVLINRPAEDLAVTSAASIPLEVSATDDIALAEVALRFSRSDQTDAGESEVSLWSSQSLPQRSSLDRLPPVQKDVRDVSYTWDLAALNLQPGTELSYYAIAQDHQPAVGQSLVRTVKIISSSELDERIARSHSRVLAELNRVIKMQQDAHSQTTLVEEQLRGTSQLRKQDRDQLRSAERSQREVARSLVSPREGVVAMLDSLQFEQSINRLDSPDLVRQVEQLRSVLNRLGTGELPIIERELTAALKSSQASRDEHSKLPPPEVLGSIETAEGLQTKVIETLQGLAAELGSTENYRQFSLDIADVRRQQQELASRTAATMPQTISKHINDLTPQQKTDLRKLAQQQGELARKLDQIQQQMQKFTAVSTDPNAEAAVQDALAVAQQKTANARMRESGGALESNQLGRSLEQQNAVIDALESVLDILSNRHEHELARLVKKLQQAEAQLDTIAAQQQKVAAQHDQAQSQAQRQQLAKRQQQLAQETERLTRELRRLEAQVPAESTADAADAMKAAATDQTASAQDHAQLAAQLLEQAKSHLADGLAQAEQELANEQVAKIQDDIIAIQQRQRSILGETERLHLLKMASPLTRGQSQSLVDLSTDQLQLKTDTEALATRLAAAEVFRVAILGIAGEMSAAHSQLARQETGPEATAAQQRALRKFELLLVALEPEQPSSSAGDGESREGDPKPAGGDSSQGLIAGIAQLKLLKLLQEDLNLRTKQFDEASANRDRPKDELERMQQALVNEQRRLAELIDALLGRTAQPRSSSPARSLQPPATIESLLPTAQSHPAVAL